MNTGPHSCPNCGQSFHGNYCSGCGQKLSHRLDTKHILHELAHGFTHTDRGIFAFIPMIMFRPGHYALNYVHGKRKAYFSIVQYLIIVVGIITFLMSRTDYMDSIASTFDPGGARSARVEAFQKELTGFLQRYLNFFLFALMPVFSLFSWLYFRRTRYNYAENFLLQMAIQAQINTWTLLVVMPLAFILPKESHSWIISLSFLILLVCMTAGYRQFFKTSTFHAFWKTLLVYVSTNIVEFILMLVAIMIIVKFKY